MQNFLFGVQYDHKMTLKIEKFELHAHITVTDGPNNSTLTQLAGLKYSFTDAYISEGLDFNCAYLISSMMTGFHR
jgi:hypothetical protein